MWLKDSTGSFVEKLELCDGSDMTAMTENFCIVPMNEFWDADMSYVAGDMVFAKISAVNERGESVISLANTVGAAVQTVPGQMIAATRGADTTA